MDEIMVSVYCLTYNHEKYIRDALEGFVMQKTSFKYEVFVHDDASTDGTRNIILEYAEKYPELITAICQEVNQWSLNVPIFRKYIMPRIQGKYIACCEGDDYWTDPYKLQKQFDEMEKHPEIDMCAHAVGRIENGKEVSVISPSSEKTVLSVEKVIAGGGGYLMTNSLFFRKSAWEKIPEFRKVLAIDYSMQINGALRGGILYIPDKMGAYRALSGPHAWTQLMKNNPAKKISQTQLTIKMLTVLNEETNYKYQEVIYDKISDLEYKLFFLAQNYKEMIKKKHRKHFVQYPIKKRLYIYLMAYFPFLGKILRRDK